MLKHIIVHLVPIGLRTVFTVSQQELDVLLFQTAGVRFQALALAIFRKSLPQKLSISMDGQTIPAEDAA